MGRNPATGEAIRIKASKKARITPVKAFKDAVLAPATAPKLVKGAFPTSDAAVAAAGKSAAPAAAKKAPARSAAKKAPARARLPPSGRRRGRPRPSGLPQRGPRRGSEQGRSPHRGPAFCVCFCGAAGSDGRGAVTRWRQARGRVPLPNHPPTGPWRSHIPTGCRRAIPPTRRSSRPTRARWMPVPTPMSTPGLG